MGNSAATGHVVAASNVHQAVGLKRTLQLLMKQHRIEPWTVHDLGHSNPLAKLRRQADLCTVSPFRFIPVKEGLSHFSKHAGGWVVQLTREKFIELSIELFDKKGLKHPIEEAKIFYDVFDSIDMYSDATLSIGELVGGLSTFFAGTLDERSKAVYDVLDQSASDKVSKSLLSQFLKPYVWSLVPGSAEVFRPILLPYVTDEIFGEMSSTPSKGHVNSSEFARWVQRGNPNAEHLKASNTAPVFSAAIFERCAQIIEGVVHAAWKEYRGKEELREYGQQTWEAGHEGQPQRLQDVGMYRYAVSNYGRSPQRSMQNCDEQPSEQPSLVRDMVSNMSIHVQGAMENFRKTPEGTPRNHEQQPGMVSNMSQQVQDAMKYFNAGGCQIPMNVADDWESDCEADAIDRSEQMQSVIAHTQEHGTRAPLPNLLKVHASTIAPPLASLPTTACGLTRPQGFPEFETATRATTAF